MQTIGVLVDLHSLSSLFKIMWQRTTTGIIRRACLHLLCCSMYNANPQLGPTTYRSQMSNGRPDPCGSAHANARGLWRCTQMCSKCWFKKQICTQWLLKNKTNTHYTPYPMSVQKANMHAQNSSALRHRSNVLDKLKGCRQTKSIAWHNYCHNIQEGGNIFIMISLIIIIITKIKTNSS